MVVAEDATDVVAAVRSPATKARRGGDGDRPRHRAPCRRRGPRQHLAHEGRARRPVSATARVERGHEVGRRDPPRRAHRTRGSAGLQLPGRRRRLHDGRRLRLAGAQVRLRRRLRERGRGGDRRRRVVRRAPTSNAGSVLGLKGGGGNFGIVTSSEFALHPSTNVYGGNLFYPVERAREVLTLRALDPVAARRDESAVAFLGSHRCRRSRSPCAARTFIAVRACYCGEDLAEGGEGLVKPLARGVGEPAMDDVADHAVHGDGLDQHGSRRSLGVDRHVELLEDLSQETIAALVDVAGAAQARP